MDVINSTLQELMGLPDPAGGKYYMKGDYDGYYETGAYHELRLICPQPDDNDCLFNGKNASHQRVNGLGRNAYLEF